MVISTNVKEEIDFKEYIEGISFVMENFEIEDGANQPDFCALIKLYYDLEYVSARKCHHFRKTEKNLTFLLRVYLTHLSRSEYFIEQYLYSIPIKLLCLFEAPSPGIVRKIGSRISISVKVNIAIALDEIKLWAEDCNCRRCAKLFLQLVSERSLIQTEQCYLRGFKMQIIRYRKLQPFIKRQMNPENELDV